MAKKLNDKIKNYTDDQLVNEYITSMQSKKSLFVTPITTLGSILVGGALSYLNPILFPLISAAGVTVGIGVVCADTLKFYKLYKELKRRDLILKVAEKEMEIYNENKRIAEEREKLQVEEKKQTKIEKVFSASNSKVKYSNVYKDITKNLNEEDQSERQ